MKRITAQTRRNRKGTNRGHPDLVAESLKGWNLVPIGLPTEYRTRLRYTSYFNSSAAGGIVGDQLVSGNSVYDPDASGVGEQPYWYDEMSQIYVKYRVVRSKIVIRLINTSTPLVRVVVLPIYSSSIPTDSYESSELPRSKFREVSGTAGGPVIAKISSGADTHDIVGVSAEASLIEDAYAANSGANPAYRWYWLIQVQNIGGFTTTIGCTCEYTIVYDVIWSGLKPDGDSVGKQTPLLAVLDLQSRRAQCAKSIMSIDLGSRPVNDQPRGLTMTRQ